MAKISHYEVFSKQWENEKEVPCGTIRKLTCGLHSANVENDMSFEQVTWTSNMMTHGINKKTQHLVCNDMGLPACGIWKPIIGVMVSAYAKIYGGFDGDLTDELL